MDKNLVSNGDFEDDLEQWNVSDHEIEIEEVSQDKEDNMFCVIKSTKAIMQNVYFSAGRYNLTFKTRSKNLGGTVAITKEGSVDPLKEAYFKQEFNNGRNEKWFEEKMEFEAHDNWKNTIIRFSANYSKTGDAKVELDDIFLTRISD